jgi:basic amino acid/polyamine antiporter, APA family
VTDPRAPSPPRGSGGAGDRAEPATGPRLGSSERLARTLGVPALFAILGAAIGSAVYFALGLVARDALALTPVAFLAAGAFFAVTIMTYVEGNSLHPERGGASTFARYAFDELWSFVAGWAILLDYLIVIAISALAISHYLAAFWGELGRPGTEVVVAALALALVVRGNVRGLTAGRLGRVLRTQLLNGVLLVAVIVVGAVVAGKGAEAERAASLIREGTPTLEGFVFAAVIATVAMTGIEAASGLAGEIRPRARALRRVVLAIAGTALVLFVGVSIVAVAILPTAGGEHALGGRFLEAPVLGVVMAFEPPAVAEAFSYVVGVVAAVVLFVGLNTFMLGLSRLVYSLATNRQIPRTLGRLHRRHGTPSVAIWVAAGVALVLVATGDLELLAGLFAFGAMLSFAIAHVSVIVLRFREPEARRPYRIPLSVEIAGARVPLLAVVGTVVAVLAWLSVVAFHEGARIAGTVWMLGGLLLYLVYRRREGQSARGRLTVAPQEIQEGGALEYGSILVPVFGRGLDDDIMGTAGRLAAEGSEPGEGGPMIEALYVFEMPMALPLDAEVPEERLAEARQALARAKEVGEEYAGVEVATATTRARKTGTAIVEEARRRGVEAIVLAAEEPTTIRGGALLGGRGGGRQRFVGDMTREVLEKSPCRVIVTAPPASENDEEQ